MTMRSWQNRTFKYFLLIAGAVLLTVIVFILSDTYKSRQVKKSLVTYMDNLRDMIFMSTYDSLKKGNMKLFKNHLEEIGTLNDVQEFSLLDTGGTIRYSSDEALVKQHDPAVHELQSPTNVTHEGYTTYYFPVETISYCSRCHLDWKLGTINSYYKLTLSRKALDTVKATTLYSHGFTVAGGGLFLAFFYLLLTLYERKKHEEQMLLSASVFENAAEAIAITKASGLVERINDAFTRITGYERGDIVGRDIHLLDAGEVNGQNYQEMREQMQTRGFWSGELWNRRKDGESIPVRLSVTPVRNIQNRTTHFISVFYDISTMKAAEQALVEMDKIKSEFISSAAHELRTPLSAMMGFTEFAREPEKFGGFSEEQIREFLDEVYDRGEALSQIIDDLLDISRIETGKDIELNLQGTSLLDLLGKAIDFHRVHQPTHVYRFVGADESDRMVCLLDRYRINQVIENLLSNAAKYSADGSEITVSCRLHEGFWEIGVSDQGIGMTPEQIEKIFDKFYRVDSTDTAVSGLGLGMSIARQIVVAHGGGINIQSEFGIGTTVTVTLPNN